MVATQPRKPNNRDRGGKGGGRPDNVRDLPRVVARNDTGRPAEQVMPQNVEAEGAVLGSVLIDADAIGEAARLLAPESFYRDAHRLIFAAAMALHDAGQPGDLIMLCAELERRGHLEEVGGTSYVSSLTNNVPTSANVAHYARLVQEAATKRALIRASGQIAALAYDDPSASAALAQAEAALAAVRDAARLDGRFRLMTLPQLDTLPLPQWLIGNTLQRDTVAMVYGRRSTGKSFLCVDLALHVASGLAWQGLTVKRGPVVYVAAEGGRGIGLRTQAWRQERGLDDVPGFYLVPQSVQMLDAGQVAEFCATLATLETPPALIVIDTLGRSMAGADETSNSDAHEIVSAADAIRRATGACVLLVHHDGKVEGRGPRGASALGDDIDTILYLKRDEESETTAVQCEKQKDAEGFPPFSFTLRKVALDQYADVTSCVIEPAEVRPASTLSRSLTDKHRAALAMLVGHPLGYTAKEWEAAANLAHATFYRVVDDLKARKLIHQANGRYYLTAEGLELVS